MSSRSQHSSDLGRVMLRNALTRVVATQEELEVGDTESAYVLLLDLESDIAETLVVLEEAA